MGHLSRAFQESKAFNTFIYTFFTRVGPRVRWVVGVGVGDIAFRDIFYFIVDFIVDFIQCMKFILYYCFLTKSTEIKDIHAYIHTIHGSEFSSGQHLKK